MSDVVYEFKEEVLVENLIALCVGDITLKQAKKDFKKRCGLTKGDYELLVSTPLPKSLTDFLLGEFAIAAYKKPVILETYLRAELTEWLDTFCYNGSVIDLLECAANFKVIDDCIVSAHKKIKKLKDKLLMSEIRELILYEGVVV
jgi:hypothetical protein